jgi:hypothetical protein
MTFFEAEQPADDGLAAVHDELLDASSRRPESLALPYSQVVLFDVELGSELLRR